MPQEYTAAFKIDISDLKSNISEANRQIKLANAEFNAASAGMDDWSKSADGVSAKLSQLDKVLEAQKKALAAYQAQMERQKEAYAENGKRAEELREKLRELREKGISETSAEYKEYEKALQSAEKEQANNQKAVENLQLSILNQEAAIGKTEKEIRQYNTKLGELGDESEDAAESTEELADAADNSAENMDDLGKSADDARKELGTLAKDASKKVEKAFLAISAAVLGVVTSLGKLVIDSAQAADDLMDLSKKTGISAEQLQKYQYTADQVGTSLETITGAQTKLVKSMNSARKGTGETAEAFKDLGVEVTNADGTLRNTDDVFNDVIDALGDIQNETDRDVVAMSLFGKSARELNPLILEGADGLRRYSEEAEELGAIVSDDVVATLADTADMLDSVKAQFNATKQTVAAEFAPVVQSVLQGVQTLLARVNEIIQDPKIKDSIDRLADAFGEFVEKAISKLIEILPKLIDGAAFLIQNFDKIAVTLGIVWAAFKGVAIVSSAITLFTTLKSALIAFKASALAAKASQLALNAAMIAAKAAAFAWVAALGAVVAILAACVIKAGKYKKALVEAATEGSRAIRTSTSEIQDSLHEARTEFEKSAEATEKTAEEAHSYVVRLKELEKQSNMTNTEQAEYKKLVLQLQKLMPDLNVEIDKETGLLKGGAQALEDQIDNWKTKMQLTALEERLTDELAKQVELQIEMEKAAEGYADMSNDVLRFNELWQKANSTIGISIDEQNELIEIAQRVTGLTDAQAVSLDVVNAAWREQNAAVNETAAAYNESVHLTDELIDRHGALSAELNTEVVPDVDETTDAIEDLGEAMDETGKKADELAEDHFNKVVGAVQNMFDKIDTSTDLSMKKIIETLQHNGAALASYQENLRTIAERGASENVMNYLESLGVEQAGVIDMIAHSSEQEFAKFNKIFEDNTAKAEKAGKEWGEMCGEGIKKGVEDKIPVIKKAGKKGAKALADAFKDFMQIESPSKLFRRFGKYTGEGYIIGFEKMVPKMAKSVLSGAQNIASSFASGINGEETGGFSVNASKAWAASSSANMQKAVNQAARKRIIGSGNPISSPVNYTQNIYSPKALSRWEIYRQTRNLVSLAEGGGTP